MSEPRRVNRWTVIDGIPELEIRALPLANADDDARMDEFADSVPELVESFLELVWFLTDHEDSSDARSLRSMEVTPAVRWFTDKDTGRGGIVEATIESHRDLGRFRMLIDSSACLAFLERT